MFLSRDKFKAVDDSLSTIRDESKYIKHFSTNAIGLLRRFAPIFANLPVAGKVIERLISRDSHGYHEY